MSNQYRNLDVGQRQALVGQGVEQAYRQADFGRFPASKLEEMNPGLRVNPATAQSAFLGNMANPFAAGFQQQRMPGAQYANYERMAPNVGGPLTAPQVPAGYVPPGTQPETIKVYPDGTPVPEETDTDVFDPSDIESNKDQFLIDINQTRAEQGLPLFRTFEEYIANAIGDVGTGYIGMAEGGIASLDPMYMAEGGIMSTIGGALRGIGSGIGRGIEALGGLAQQGLKNYEANQKKFGIQQKRLEDMTREELLEYIKSGGKSPAGGNNLGGLKNLANMFTDSVMNRPTGGTAALGEMGDLSMLGYADGGDVEYPRMNGPISGPGTETSDDIPAMLSDGEFVVNAKAVRGIGRLEGAGKSKEEQRREGARMMYALQRAGEKAMRKA